jgi:hypothetical protein
LKQTDTKGKGMELASQTSAAILRRAAELVEKGHVKGMLATNRNGFVVNSTSEEACHFCVLGAILRASWDVYQAADFQDCSRTVVRIVSEYGKTKGIIDRRNRALPGTQVSFWNDADERKPEEVSKLLRDVADAVEKDAA